MNLINDSTCMQTFHKVKAGVEHGSWIIGGYKMRAHHSP